MKLKKLTLGATLLEIMLVLAVAAMIIVMSVRYYQTSSSSNQANAYLAQIQAMNAAAVTLAGETGDLSVVDTAGIKSLMPSQSMKTPWGGDITIDSGATATSFSVTASDTPIGTCTALVARLKVDTHYTNLPDCTSVGDFTFTYTTG
jgi:Tfp pilus assembly protein FimT